VPGFINLLPDEISRPKRTGPEEVIPVSNEAMPNFGTPDILIPDNFWSNLKQFLFERPVKVIERSDVPFTKNSFGSGMRENLKFFLSAPAAPKHVVNKRLEVDWGGNFGGFGDRIKDKGEALVEFGAEVDYRHRGWRIMRTRDGRSDGA